MPKSHPGTPQDLPAPPRRHPGKVARNGKCRDTLEPLAGTPTDPRRPSEEPPEPSKDGQEPPKGQRKIIETNHTSKQTELTRSTKATKEHLVSTRVGGYAGNNDIKKSNIHYIQ